MSDTTPHENDGRRSAPRSLAIRLRFAGLWMLWIPPILFAMRIRIMDNSVIDSLVIWFVACQLIALTFGAGLRGTAMAGLFLWLFVGTPVLPLLALGAPSLLTLVMPPAFLMGIVLPWFAGRETDTEEKLTTLEGERALETRAFLEKIGRSPQRIHVDEGPTTTWGGLGPGLGAFELVLSRWAVDTLTRAEFEALVAQVAAFGRHVFGGLQFSGVLAPPLTLLMANSLAAAGMQAAIDQTLLLVGTFVCLCAFLTQWRVLIADRFAASVTSTAALGSALEKSRDACPQRSDMGWYQIPFSPDLPFFVRRAFISQDQPKHVHGYRLLWVLTGVLVISPWTLLVAADVTGSEQILFAATCLGYAPCLFWGLSALVALGTRARRGEEAALRSRAHLWRIALVTSAGITLFFLALILLLVTLDPLGIDRVNAAVTIGVFALATVAIGVCAWFRGALGRRGSATAESRTDD